MKVPKKVTEAFEFVKNKRQRLDDDNPHVIDGASVTFEIQQYKKKTFSICVRLFMSKVFHIDEIEFYQKLIPLLKNFHAPCPHKKLEAMKKKIFLYQYSQEGVMRFCETKTIGKNFQALGPPKSEQVVQVYIATA